MKNVIIGIVSRPIRSNSNRNMLGVYESYIRSVIKSGGIPLIISPTQNIEYEKYNIHVELNEIEKNNLINILKVCDGIILPGGEIGYKYDYFILDYAIKNDIPILGICLGLQIMTKSDTIPAYNHYMVNHKIEIEENSTLYKIFNKKIIYVNSRHKEQVKNSGEYKVIARIDDTIEAIELEKNTFNLGVQFHPEDLEEGYKIFDYFIKKIKQKK